MANYQIQLGPVFHALADPTRRAIVGRLGLGRASVKELAEPFDMALPSFMKHLAVLEESGLVISTKAGRVRTCAINPEGLATAEDWLAEQRKVWEARTDRFVEFVERMQQKENGT